MAYGKGGKAEIDDFVQGGIEGGFPAVHSSGLAPAGRVDKEDRSRLFCARLSRRKAAFLCVYKDFLYF